MIDALKAFLNGYRAAGIKETRGMEGLGFYATLVKDGKVLGEIYDFGDGGCVSMRLENRADEQALIAYSKEKYPELQFEPEGSFLSALIDYELSIKKIKTQAAKYLLVSDESKVDEHGVATSYTYWKLPPTPENRAKILAKSPNIKFLNDELAQWETLKVVRRRK